MKWALPIGSLALSLAAAAAAWIASRDARSAAETLADIERRIAARDAVVTPPRATESQPDWESIRSQLQALRRDAATMQGMLAELASARSTRVVPAGEPQEPSTAPVAWKPPLERLIDSYTAHALQALMEADAKAANPPPVDEEIINNGSTTHVRYTAGEAAPHAERAAILRRAIDSLASVTSVDELLAWKSEYRDVLGLP